MSSETFTRAAPLTHIQLHQFPMKGMENNHTVIRVRLKCTTKFQVDEVKAGQ
jgi:hypothetical protein